MSAITLLIWESFLKGLRDSLRIINNFGEYSYLHISAFFIYFNYNWWAKIFKFLFYYWTENILEWKIFQNFSLYLYLSTAFVFILKTFCFYYFYFALIIFTTSRKPFPCDKSYSGFASIMILRVGDRDRKDKEIIDHMKLLDDETVVKDKNGKRKTRDIVDYLGEFYWPLDHHLGCPNI